MRADFRKPWSTEAAAHRVLSGRFTQGNTNWKRLWPHLIRELKEGEWHGYARALDDILGILDDRFVHPFGALREGQADMQSRIRDAIEAMRPPRPPPAALGGIFMPKNDMEDGA
ncbi:hypothetical protein [Blastochloris tepida]|uniref:Uncharacterized protein n=1 Tax=Blastochloris tepida TaxID=2233851 RepID=A0A348FZE5_9HYPH|nr:hypothetical protein [Blastochloris tepida]BBF92678.1 hypothetical protein BLTE_13630 [Blastochloris tepida]